MKEVEIMGCSHKTLNDHSKPSGDVRVWTCSCCGKAERWSDDWGYFGNLECSRCWMAEVDFAYCSEVCRVALVQQHGLKDERGDGSKAKTKPVPKKRVPSWQRKAEAAGWKPT